MPKLELPAELMRNLAAVAPTVKRAIMRPALRKGAAVVAKQAKKNAPKRFGWLKKSIKYSPTKKGDNARVYVKPQRIEEPRAHTKTGTVNPRNYAHLVEFGTSNAEAHPFLRPALMETRSAQMVAVTAEAVKQFDKQYRKGRTG